MTEVRLVPTVIVVGRDDALRARVAHAARAGGCMVLQRNRIHPMDLLPEHGLLIIVDPGTGIPAAIPLAATLRAVPALAIVASLQPAMEVAWLATGIADVVDARTSLPVLTARIMRRISALTADRRVRVSHLSLACADRIVAWGPREASISRPQCAVLEILMRDPASVHSRDQLRFAAREDGCSDRALESLLHRLRGTVLRIGGPPIARAVPTAGYRLGLP